MVNYSPNVFTGFLSAVGYLNVVVEGFTIFLNWTEPFTLDLSAVRIDVTYCVDVVSSASSATLHSDCGINVTEFTYPLTRRNGCDAYTFTVTPVNVVGNGTRKSTEYDLSCKLKLRPLAITMRPLLKDTPPMQRNTTSERGQLLYYGQNECVWSLLGFHVSLFSSCTDGCDCAFCNTVYFAHGNFDALFVYCVSGSHKKGKLYYYRLLLCVMVIYR